MRIPKTFGLRTDSERQAVKKYYLIYEGSKTEAQYFSGIGDNKELLNINSLIEIVPILRSYNEEDWSNPQKILDKLICYISEKSDETIVVDTFLDKVIDWLLEEQIISNNAIYNGKNLKYELANLFESKDMVIKISEASEVVATFLTTELNLCDSVNQIEEYIKMQFVTYEAGYDKICLIADRDRQSFKENQYDYVVRTCKEKGYDFYISNPCFEFWLLLHYDEVLDIDREKLLINPKDSPRAKKRFLEKELSSLMCGYSKNNLQFDKLADKVFNAVGNEKQFCEDISGLKTQLGCNIGLLINEMQQ